jgi:hypothetical protein
VVKLCSWFNRPVQNPIQDFAVPWLAEAPAAEKCQGQGHLYHLGHMGIPTKILLQKASETQRFETTPIFYSYLISTIQIIQPGT